MYYDETELKQSVGKYYVQRNPHYLVFINGLKIYSSVNMFYAICRFPRTITSTLLSGGNKGLADCGGGEGAPGVFEAPGRIQNSLVFDGWKLF